MNSAPATAEDAEGSPSNSAAKPELVEGQCEGRRVELLAGLYGLHLRERGYAPDEAAQLVIRRYPGMRRRLQALANRPSAPGLAWRSGTHD